MILKRALVIALLLAGVLPATLAAEDPPKWNLEASNPQGWAEYDWVNRVAHGTNGVIFTYSGAILVAESMKVNEDSGEVFADGAVRIQREEQVWIGEHIIYNFKTRQI